MNWTLDKSRPIAKQICEKICVAIAAGELTAGERLLSVREVALLAGVNPNTVQKAFEELERIGAVSAVPSSGRYVSESTDAAVAEVIKLRRTRSLQYLSDMAQLGCSSEEAIAYLTMISEEGRTDAHE